MNFNNRYTNFKINEIEEESQTESDHNQNSQNGLNSIMKNRENQYFEEKRDSQILNFEELPPMIYEDMLNESKYQAHLQSSNERKNLDTAHFGLNNLKANSINSMDKNK